MFNKLIQLAQPLLIPYHDEAQNFMTKHIGKALTIIITDIHKQYTLHIHQSGILVSNHSSNCDAEIITNLDALLSFIGKKRTGSKINIQGDQSLAMAFLRLLNKNALDTHAIMEALIGQEGNTLLYTLKQELSHISQEYGRRMKEQLHDYLVDESETCINHTAADQQYEDISQLKWRLQQLEQRIKNIQP